MSMSICSIKECNKAAENEVIIPVQRYWEGFLLCSEHYEIAKRFFEKD